MSARFLPDKSDQRHQDICCSMKTELFNKTSGFSSRVISHWRYSLWCRDTSSLLCSEQTFCNMSDRHLHVLVLLKKQDVSDEILGHFHIFNVKNSRIFP